MKFVLPLITLLLVGCVDKDHYYENQEQWKKHQVSALTEYLKENAILEKPTIISNYIQFSNHDKEFRGVIKYKFAESKRVQTVKCYTIRQLTHEWSKEYTYNFFCGV